MLGGQRGRRTRRHDEIHFEPDQFGYKGGEPLEIPIGRPKLQRDVLALHVSQLPQPLPEGIPDTRHLWGGGRNVHETTDPANIRRRLPLTGAWRSEESEDEHGDGCASAP